MIYKIIQVFYYLEFLPKIRLNFRSGNDENDHEYKHGRGHHKHHHHDDENDQGEH